MIVNQTHTNTGADTTMVKSNQTDSNLTVGLNIKALKTDTQTIVPKAKITTHYSLHPFKADTFYAFYKKQFERPLNNQLILSDSTSESTTSMDPNAIVLRGLNSEYQEISHQSFLHGNPRTTFTDNWIFFLLLLCFMLLGILRFSFNKVLSQTFRSIINYREAYKLYLEGGSTYTFANIALNIIFFLSFGLYLFFLVSKSLPVFTQLPGFLFFGDLLLLLFGFIVLKFVLYKLMGALFNVSDLVNEYLHLGSVYNKIGGVLFLPLVVLLQYLPVESNNLLYYTGVGIFIIMYSWQLLRGIQIIIQKNLSVYYSILYLCTIEILPLFLISKLILEVR